MRACLCVFVCVCVRVCLYVCGILRACLRVRACVLVRACAYVSECLRCIGGMTDMHVPWFRGVFCFSFRCQFHHSSTLHKPPVTDW